MYYSRPEKRGLCRLHYKMPSSLCSDLFFPPSLFRVLLNFFAQLFIIFEQLQLNQIAKWSGLPSWDIFNENSLKKEVCVAMPQFRSKKKENTNFLCVVVVRSPCSTCLILYLYSGGAVVLKNQFQTSSIFLGRLEDDECAPHSASCYTFPEKHRSTGCNKTICCLLGRAAKKILIVFK